MNEIAIAEMLKKQEQTLNKIEKRLSAPQQATNKLDIEEVKNLSAKLETSIEKIGEVVETARTPIVSERKFTIEITSKSTLSIFIGMLVIIILLFVKLYHETRPNYDQQDNDLKYRYIKMKGEASPTTISTLEDLFEINRDYIKIKEMLQTVESYEEAVHKRAIIDEQTRLKQQESDKLNEEATELKSK